MKQVLLVENEMIWQIRLTKILVKAGFYVTLVASIPDVIESLLEVGKPSLVIVDASLSQSVANRDGCAIVEKMKGIPTVCISAYMDPEEVKRLGLMGRFVDKNSFDKKIFLNIVEDSISMSKLEVSLLVRLTVFIGQIVSSIFAFLAGTLVVWSIRNSSFWGLGRGYFLGLGISCAAMSIECLLCLKFLSYYYELRPKRRKNGEEKNPKK